MYVVNEMTDSGISVASKFYSSSKALFKDLEKDLEERDDVGKINIVHNRDAYALVFTKRKVQDIDFSATDFDELLKQGHVQLFPNVLRAERSLRALETRRGRDQVYQAVIISPESKPDEFGEGIRRKDFLLHQDEQF